MEKSDDNSMMRGEETDIVSAGEKAAAAVEELQEVDHLLKQLRHQKIYETHSDDVQKVELESRLRARKFNLRRLLKFYQRMPEFSRRIAEKRAAVLRGRVEFQKLRTKLLGKAAAEEVPAETNQEDSNAG